MFGDQGDTVSAPRAGAPQDGTLNGVNDIASGAPADNGQGGGFMPAPSEPVRGDAPEPQTVAADTPAPSATSSSDAGGDELLELKQRALQQLTPIVGHLDQSPEEKFRTTMMLIQASDNQALLKEAYEAANAIEDEKAKAQALLDVINEINYFTQNSQKAE